MVSSVNRYNTKLPSFVDIIHRTSLGFPASALEAQPHDVWWIISTHSGGFVYLLYT